MRTEKQYGSWVVYLMNLPKKESRNAVCQQSEWDEMELFQPGKHPIIQCGIESEAEAELLARGTSGDQRVHLKWRRAARNLS
jgi:hypothetical protein